MGSWGYKAKSKMKTRALPGSLCLGTSPPCLTPPCLCLDSSSLLQLPPSILEVRLWTQTGIPKHCVPAFSPKPAEILVPDDNRNRGGVLYRFGRRGWGGVGGRDGQDALSPSTLTASVSGSLHSSGKSVYREVAQRTQGLVPEARSCLAFWEQKWGV